MANIVFDRYYEITFKSVEQVNVQGSGNATPSILTVYTLKSNDSGEGRSSLQVTGVIKRELKVDGDSPDNTLELKITNLPTEVVSLLDSTDLLKVSVKLGYNNSISGDAVTEPLIAEVFEGAVKDFSEERNGLNSIVSIAAITSITEKSGSELNMVFRKGSSVRKMFERIVKSFTEAYLSSADNTKTYLSGDVSTIFEGGILDNLYLDNDRTKEGMTSKVLSELCKEYKVSWTMQKDGVYIYSKDTRKEDNSYSLITIEPQNIIGGLGYHSDSVGKNKKDVSKTSSVTMKTFLDPRVNIDTVYELPKELDKGGVKYSGKYLPTSWNHVFNYRGNDYYTQLILSRTTLEETNNG